MKRSRAGGWAAFAATMLFVVGAVNIVQGIIALFTPEYFLATEGEILVFDFTVWGLILGIWGIVLVVAAAAMISGRIWARALVAVIAAANAFAQLAFIDAHPVWSLVVIAVDVLIVYGATAGWSERAPAGDDAYAAGRADARAPAGAREHGAGGERAPEAGAVEGYAEPGAAERERYGGASTQEARQAAGERPPGTRPGKHEQPMS
ncbi:hypothetical protein [Streptomonospora sp. PA3]|uniref:DUF7144 family membrane protein n=1 Tax=Streptomonospora sp. PA3 TaxID=2607326 RepID=UPI001642B171|nr:hypothetical protein [Streptomonospora sp. PA3]